MTDRSEKSVLKRYSGRPVDSGPVFHPDNETDWREFLSSRKHLAWNDVRLIARRSRRAAQEIHPSRGRPCEHWIRLRKELSFALGVWAHYRRWIDWLDKPESSP